MNLKPLFDVMLNKALYEFLERYDETMSAGINRAVMLGMTPDQIAQQMRDEGAPDELTNIFKRAAQHATDNA